MEPSLKDPATGAKRSEASNLQLYVTYIIRSVLEWEKSIGDFAKLNLFNGVDRSELAVTGNEQTDAEVLVAAIESVYENSFKAPVGRKVSLGLPGIRTHFRVCRRVLDYLSENHLPITAIHIQAAISNIVEVTGATKGWKGTMVSTSLAWLGQACASEDLVKFARRSEIAQYVHGGIASVLKKSKPTQHAPWPADHNFLTVEDLCSHPNEEVAIAAAMTHLAYVGVRMGNTLLAYNIEIQDPALDESKEDIRPEYPPCSHPLADPESALVRFFEVPRAVVHLTHTKGSGGPAETVEVHVPLIDSRRRSLTRAYSLWRDRIAAIRAAGVEASAVKKSKSAHKSFTDAVAKMDGTAKKPGLDPLDGGTTPIEAAMHAEHNRLIMEFLAAPPATPYEAADERDLIRNFRAMARISKADERAKDDSARSPHTKYPVKKLTGHSCRRFFNTVLGLADVDQAAINLTMDWAASRESRMSTNYNANKHGRIMMTRLRGIMLLGAKSFSCPLPEQPYDTTWTFHGIKDWFFQYMDPESQSTHARQVSRARARARARIAAIQETTSMEAEGASQPSQMDDEDMEQLARGYSPDIKAMPTRSTGRYDLSPGVERDAAALAHMLPTQPSDADRDEVAFQAWRDAAIQMKPTQEEDDETVVLLDAQEAPTK